MLSRVVQRVALIAIAAFNPIANWIQDMHLCSYLLVAALLDECKMDTGAFVNVVGYVVCSWKRVCRQ